jgi:dihydroorotate dehydrogenase electron transfer subunit
VTGDFEARAVSVRKIAADTTELWLELPESSSGISPEPGQFAHISADGIFLRRPISIAGFDAGRNRVKLIVRSSGSGSAKIAGISPGESLKMLLPLGSPFPISSARDGVWLVGGGIGTAPLLFAAERLPEARLFIGFRNEDSSFGREELASRDNVSFVTGGLVTNAVARALEAERPGVIFACGPPPMLAALKKICETREMAAFASLEERMGCGIGACLCCNCRIKKRGEESRYVRVCRDGPVFDLSEVVFP